jgi:hypothetical protein
LFKEYLSGSDSSGIRDLLAKSTDTDKIAEMINNAFGYDKVKELLSGLDSNGIRDLLKYSTDKDKIAEMIINAKGDKLDWIAIPYLLIYSKDKDGLKRLLDKYGISYEKNESVKSMLRDKLISESFDFGSMTDEEQSKVFDVFKKSYEKSTGVSWDINKFRSRASNWVFFGDNNITKAMVDEYSVIKRFTKRQSGVDIHIKSIVKLTNDLVMGVHNPINKSLCNTNREIFTGPFNYNKLNNIAQINHYFTKTQEEFIEKINRGRADVQIKRTLNDFNPHNLNDIEDYTALKFMYGDSND